MNFTSRNFERAPEYITHALAIRDENWFKNKDNPGGRDKAIKIARTTLLSKIKIKNENSVLLRAALGPLYMQSISTTKTPLIYTQYRKAKLMSSHDHLTPFEPK